MRPVVMRFVTGFGPVAVTLDERQPWVRGDVIPWPDEMEGSHQRGGPVGNDVLTPDRLRWGLTTGGQTWRLDTGRQVWHLEWMVNGGAKDNAAPRYALKYQEPERRTVGWTRDVVAAVLAEAELLAELTNVPTPVRRGRVLAARQLRAALASWPARRDAA